MTKNRDDASAENRHFFLHRFFFHLHENKFLSNCIRMNKYISVSFLAFFLVACSSDRGLITDVKVCDTKTENRCLETKSEFSPDAPEIFASAIVSKLASKSHGVFIWSYAENGRDFREISRADVMTANETDVLSSTLSKLNNSWPAGTYQVRLEMSGVDIQPAQIFRIVADSNNETAIPTASPS